MHQSPPSSDRSWARTCGTWKVTQPPAVATEAVSTVRVKLVGANPDAVALPPQRRFDKTQSYGRVLPSPLDCIAVDSGVDEERNVYMDVTGWFEQSGAFDASVAFARTLPALPPANVLTSSGVRPRERLSLRLEPRDRVQVVESDSPTLKVSAMTRSSASQTWRVWLASSAAAAICFMSVLALQWLTP